MARLSCPDDKIASSVVWSGCLAVVLHSSAHLISNCNSIVGPVQSHTLSTTHQDQLFTRHYRVGHVTLEVLIRSAPNLSQISAISFLLWPPNLFESTMEKKWRHLANNYGNGRNTWQILLVVLFSTRKISKNDRALINFFTSGIELELTTFVEKVFREEFGLDKRGPAAEEN